MTIRFKYFILIILGVSYFSIAQVPKIVNSKPLDEYKGFSKSIDEYITTIDGDHFYSATINKFKSHYHIKRFNSNFEETLDQEITTDKEGVVVKNIFGLDKTIYMMTLHDDLKNKNHTFHIAAFDRNIKLISGVTLADFSISSRKYEPTSFLKFSKDSSLIALVSFPTDHHIKSIYYDIYVNIVDRKLNKTHSYHRKLPYNQNEFDYLDSWIDVNGETFVFGALKKAKQPYQHIVFPLKDTLAKAIPIDIGNIHALSFSTGSTSGNNFVVGGFTAKDFYDISTGFFLVEIDPTQKKIVKSVKQQFSQSDLDLFIKANIYKENGKLKGLNAKYAQCDILYSCLNDKYLLSMESVYYKYRDNVEKNTTLGALGIVFDPDLNITDKFIIPRELYLSGQYAKSFSFCDDKAIYYIFNDNTENLNNYDITKTKIMEDGCKSTPVVYRYDIHKNVKKFAVTNLNYKLVVKSLKKVNGNKVGFILVDNFFLNQVA